MIKINLLPQEMAGGRAGATRSASGSGSAMVVLALLAIFLVDAGAAAFLFFNYNDAKTKFDSKKKEADSLRAEMTKTQIDYNSTQSSYDRMNRLIAVADALDPPDRLLWSRKLNMLPLLVPEGIFTTQLQVSQKVTERETQESIKRRNDYAKSKANSKGAAPVIEKVPVFAQTLAITGIAYVAEGTENQRLDYIVQFNRNLTNVKKKLPFDATETSFMEGFNSLISPSAVKSEKKDGRDVTTFTFMINAKPVTIEEKTSAGDSQVAATTPANANATQAPAAAKSGTL